MDVHINSAARIHCAPEWSLNPSWARALHDYDLWHVCAGRGRMITSQGEIDLYPGRGLWMRPGRRYEATHDPRHRLWVVAIHFDLRRGRRVLCTGEYHPPVEVFEALDPDYVETALIHVVELFNRHHSAARPLFRALLLELGWSGSGSGEENAVARHHRAQLTPILKEINEHPERTYVVAELASRAGYSPDHFARIFRRVTGQTPKEYALRARMQRAAILLRETSHTATQIAAQLGYEDLSFFTRQFGDRMGASPGSFRHRRSSI